MKIASKNSRVVVHLSYRPTLTFLGEVVQRSKSIEANFKDWTYQGNNQLVTFFDNVKHKRLTVSSNLMELVIEDPVSLESVIEEYSLAFATYFADSDLVEFRSYGSIFFSLDNGIAEYAGYASAFYEKYYKVKSDFTNLLADQVNDVVFVANAVKDGFTTSVKFAPLKNEQIDAEYPKENYREQVRFKSGIPILANTSATSSLACSKEEVSAKIEKSLIIAYKLHTKARSMATEGF